MVQKTYINILIGWISLVVFCFGTFPVFGQVGDGGRFDPTVIEPSETKAIFSKNWIPAQLKDTIYRTQVLQLADNQHLLEEIGEYDIFYEEIIIIPARDSIIIYPPTGKRTVYFDTIEIKDVWKFVDSEAQELDKVDFSKGNLHLIEEFLKMNIGFDLKEGETIPRTNQITANSLNYIPVKAIDKLVDTIPTDRISWLIFHESGQYIAITWTVFNINGRLKARAEDMTIIIRRENEVQYTPFRIDTISLPTKVKRVAYIFPQKKLSSKLNAKVIFSNLKGKTIHKKGRWSDWEKIDVYKEDLIKDIQTALNEKGYETPINNVLGIETKKILNEFMRDNCSPFPFESIIECLLGKNYELLEYTRFF